ncbi:MAG: Uma2 family endonuclease [Bacteroidetes bacterium]|nr:Uma2 family endonuclease [Bacteroidota bacterium]
MAETVTLPHEIADARTVSHVVLPNRTYDDFAALPEGTLAQLIDGDIIVSPAPNVKHQLVVSRLSTLFANFVDERRLGVVFGSPLDVRLTLNRVFQPDIVFVARERLGILGEQEVEGAPDLVVEVLSRSTGTYDLTKKRSAYEEAGVAEYWIVDPESETVEILELEEGVYRTAVRSKSGGHISSGLLEGFEVDTATLFEEPGRHRS